MGSISTWGGGSPSKSTLKSYVHDAAELEFSLFRLQESRKKLKEKLDEAKRENPLNHVVLKFSHLNGTIQWFSIYSQSCINTAQWLNSVLLEHCYHLMMSLTPTPAPGNHRSALCPCGCAYSGHFMESRVVLVTGCSDVSKVHPCHSVYQKFLSC